MQVNIVGICKMINLKSTNERYARLELKDNQTYIFDRYLFIGAIVCLLIVAISMIFYLGGLDANKYLYIHCDNKGGCENQLYNNFNYCGKTIPLDSIVCTQEVLPYGFEAGKKPPAIVNNFGLITGIIIGLMFIINHFIHNRTFRFKKLFDEVQ